MSLVDVTSGRAVMSRGLERVLVVSLRVWIAGSFRAFVSLLWNE